MAAAGPGAGAAAAEDAFLTFYNEVPPAPPAPARPQPRDRRSRAGAGAGAAGGRGGAGRSRCGRWAGGGCRWVRARPSPPTALGTGPAFGRARGELCSRSGGLGPAVAEVSPGRARGAGPCAGPSLWALPQRVSAKALPTRCVLSSVNKDGREI